MKENETVFFNTCHFSSYKSMGKSKGKIMCRFYNQELPMEPNLWMLLFATNI